MFFIIGENDFISQSNPKNVTLLPNSQVTTISITIQDDEFYEESEEFYVILMALDESGVITESNATIMIYDDDGRLYGVHQREIMYYYSVFYSGSAFP